MTADQFAAQLELLIVQAREDGLSDETIIKELIRAVDALDDGLS